MTNAIELTEINFTYPAKRKLFGNSVGHHALRDISLSARTGECVGIIGESGSGKSTLARVINGTLQPDTGSLSIAGETIESKRRRPDLLQKVQMVFQNPYASLDPTWPIWASIAEGLLIQGVAKAKAREKAISVMELVNLDPELSDNRPHALSGGQRQRVAIARALAVDPDILLLDEPTSALDLTVQAGFLNLLLDLQRTAGLTYLLITHDIDVIAHMAHHVSVMRDGQIVEAGTVDAIIKSPSHEYTRSLIAASPRVEDAV